jgi:hypothetical protein
MAVELVDARSFSFGGGGVAESLCRGRAGTFSDFVGEGIVLLTESGSLAGGVGAAVALSSIEEDETADLLALVPQ